MRFTIDSYIRALLSVATEGALKGLTVPLDHLGKPTFYAGRGYLSFEVELNGTPHLLTLPLERIVPTEVLATLERFGAISSLADKRFVPDALLVAAPDGSLHPCHALVEPRHTPLHSFVRQNHSAARRQLLRNAIESIAQALAELYTNGLGGRPLSHNELQFGPKGELHIAIYPLAAHGHNLSDFQTLASAAILLFVGASEIEAYKLLTTPPTSPKDVALRLRNLTAAAEHYNIAPLATLATLLLHRGSPHAFAEAVAMLAREPFRPMPLLTRLLSARTGASVSATPIEPQPFEPAKVDPTTFEEVCPPCEFIRRAFKGGYWYYLNADNTLIPTERPLLAAFDFYEGRAVVRTERGYGLIDRRGHWAMRDKWDDMAWFGPENIAVAASEGVWYIYDRQGRQLSTMAAEWLGDASEGFVIGRRGRKYAFYSTNGRLLTDFAYDEAHAFCEGVALVERRGQRYYIDTTFHKLSAREQEKVLTRNKSK